MTSNARTILMSIICDMFGERIFGSLYVKLGAEGREPANTSLGFRRSRDAFLGHFHTASREGRPSCFDQAQQAFWALLHARGDLEAIPTASPQKITALRRKHRKD